MQGCLGPRRRGYAGSGLVILMLIGGCSTVSAPPPSSQDAEQHWQARQSRQHKHEHNTNANRHRNQSEREGRHVALHWQQDGGHFRMLFSAPLGQGSAQLEGDERRVTLTAADGQRWVAADAKKHKTQKNNTPLPVSGLRYWVLGLPAPDTPSTHGLDGQGRLQWLE